MENQVKSKYLWVLGLIMHLGGMEKVYKMWDFSGITFGHKISVTTNGGKVYSIPNKFPTSSKVRGYLPLFFLPLRHYFINKSRLLTGQQHILLTFSF